jgi:hypothetical protein
LPSLVIVAKDVDDLDLARQFDAVQPRRTDRGQDRNAGHLHRGQCALDAFSQPQHLAGRS